MSRTQTSDLKTQRPQNLENLDLETANIPQPHPSEKIEKNCLTRKLSSSKIWLENSDPQTAVTKKWRILIVSVSGLGCGSYEFATNCRSEQVGIITSRFKERKILRSEVQNNPGNKLGSHSRRVGADLGNGKMED